MDKEQLDKIAESMTLDDFATLFDVAKRKFGIAGTYYTRNDIFIDSDDPEMNDFGYDEDITDAEWDVVLGHSHLWPEGVVAQMIAMVELPCVERRKDGSFQVSDTVNYTGWWDAEGNKIEEDK